MPRTKEGNLYWISREIAKRANFTIGDVEIILRTFKEVLEEEIAFKRPFIFTGLFKMQVKEIPAHDGWNAVENKPQFIEKAHRIVLTPSRSLLHLLRDPDDSDPS
jgi:hypothetical protein